MKPEINSTVFGSIVVEGITYDHDIVIEAGGAVKKRKKKLSKKYYGTSHTVSEEEIGSVYSKGAQKIIIGSGQTGLLDLSPEARSFLESKGCEVLILPTADAVRIWNASESGCLGLFHVTC